MSPQTALDVFIDMQEFASQGRVRQVLLCGNSPLGELLPALIALLPLPVTDQGIPLVYFLHFGDRRLEADSSLLKQGVVAGSVLTIQCEFPAGRSAAVGIRQAGIGNVRWHCFISHEPCRCIDLQWDPTLVPVVFSPEYTKSESVWEYTIKPAIRGVGLSPTRVQGRVVKSAQTGETLAPTTLDHSPSECWAVRENCEVLSLMCRHAQQGLLSVVDLTGARDAALLNLGLLWGVGQPTILLLKEKAYMPVPLPTAQIIRYGEPGDTECIRRIRQAMQKMTGIAEVDVCCVCGELFASEETMVVCIKCRALYHTHDWPGECRCGGRGCISL